MNRYLTTTLPYVNASPHIGFALEIVQADALVRAWRAAGDEVFFNTGTDEHGQKIFEAAEKGGEAVEAYVDRYAAEFRELAEALNLSVSRFIRTTDPGHVAAAQEMWKRCEASGDIYKKSYTGMYCVGCESFKTEKEIVDGRCELHPSLMLEEVTEENYFFRLSKYQDYLAAYLSNESSVIPDWRRQEALNFVKGGLEDFSISRESKRLSWGIPVPGDDTQVMYVWFDALTNYISTLGWPDERGDFKKFWQDGTVVQVAGKDQVRFQSVMWQAMLKSAGVKATDQVFYHGFITSGGAKMSKSLGNVISPYDLVNKYGTDATRYVLLRHVHPAEDSDVTWERLDEWYTANLVNGLGNLVARVMKLAETHLSAPVAIDTIVAEKHTSQEALARFAFNEALDAIWREIATLDENLTNEAPFKVVKLDPAQGRALIAGAVEHLARIAIALAPLLPATSNAILAAIVTNTKPVNLFPRLPE
ncbi:MAG TPA: methionine--tRNA ligase [Candidatus Paceibacterota bacterium]|nr:methionine--tRNA ligase [Candidatus Paceibacterota bacterium]